MLHGSALYAQDVLGFPLDAVPNFVADFRLFVVRIAANTCPQLDWNAVIDTSLGFRELPRLLMVAKRQNSVLTFRPRGALVGCVSQIATFARDGTSLIAVRDRFVFAVCSC